MHIGARIGVGVAVLGLVFGTTPVVHAAPTAERPGIAATVTLITGDQVVMRGGEVAMVRPGEGREKLVFSTFTAGEHVHVIPSDAQRLVASGQVDRRLFDVTTLVEFGYDDEHRDTMPLIVTHPAGQRAPRIAGEARELPSINGVATAAGKNGATWESLTDGTATRTAAAGVSKVWLDGKRRSTLDRSAVQIGAPAAWEAGLTGAGVKVAVLDTGVDQTHPDLADREVAEQNFTDMPDNVDNAGHGTHVASIVAGTGAKSGGKYRGIADGASIMDGKVLDDYGWGYDSWIIAGMEWAAQQGADIVNMSLGGPDWVGLDPMEQAVESLTAQYGTLFVVAAGNWNPLIVNVSSPSTAPSALSVGAVDRDDKLADFSLTGPAADGAIKPDVTAPGVGIVAARHSAGTIGTPVEDGYTALTGTSMATPHVAGAAAILAQQHPEWTGQQLKAALSGSARPSQGPTAFEQGAGRIDVAQAMDQTVVSEPTSLDFGTVAWPHDDDQPVARTLTYRNLGTTDTTLDLTTDNPVFSLSTNRVTVPAGGTVDVTVTGDTRQGTVDGLYSAGVVATAGGTVTRTPVVIIREEEKYDLTLNYVDEHGQPTDKYRTTVAGLDDGSTTYPYDADGSATVRLPKGRYLLDHRLPNAQDTHLNMIVQPELVLDRDMTLDVDPAVTRPVSVTPPAAATLMHVDIGFQVKTDQLYYRSGAVFVSDLSAVTTAQLGNSTEGQTNVVNTQWEGTDTPNFALAWFPDRFPTGFTKKVGWHQLATVHMALGVGAKGDTGVPFLIPEPQSGTMGTGSFGREIALPGTHTAYVNTDGVRWRGMMWFINDDWPVADLTSTPRSYRAGGTYHERFNYPMFGPALPEPTVFPWVYRREDAIYTYIPLFSDGAGNAGFAESTPGSTKLYLNDQLVAESSGVAHGYLPDLPAAPGKYRLTMEAANPGRFGPTASVSGEWTFDSSHVDVNTALPLNVVRFLPELTEDGSAPAGKPFAIPMKVQDETGKYHRPKKLAVEVSYDEGTTWHHVPVTANQVAKLNHPAGAPSVSLRASATDRDGNTVKQTVIRAYTLR